MSSQSRFSNPPGVGVPNNKARASQVARVGDWLLISGQIGIRPDGSVPTGLREQTALVFGHLKAAVESEGMSMGDIVKFTTYLTEASQAAEFSAAREELFAELYPEGGYPANTTVVVKGLVLPELLIEIEAIAHA